MSGDSLTKSDQPHKKIDTVPALRRAVNILDLVAASGGVMSATDITRTLSLPKSTVHGQLHALTDLGLLVKAADGTYRLGPHLMRWAEGFLSQMDIISLFRDYFAADTLLAGLHHHPYGAGPQRSGLCRLPRCRESTRSYVSHRHASARAFHRDR